MSDWRRPIRELWSVFRGPGRAAASPGNANLPIGAVTARSLGISPFRWGPWESGILRKRVFCSG